MNKEEKKLFNIYSIKCKKEKKVYNPINTYLLEIRERRSRMKIIFIIYGQKGLPKRAL